MSHRLRKLSALVFGSADAALRCAYYLAAIGFCLPQMGWL